MNTTNNKKKKSSRLQLAVHLTTALIASCVVAGVAFSYGLAASKPPIVQAGDTDRRVNSAYFNAGVEFGANDAAREVSNQYLIMNTDLKALDGKHKVAFQDGYKTGWEEQQLNAAKAGILYGTCLQMNMKTKEGSLKGKYKDSVSVTKYDGSDTKITLSGGFANGVYQSYRLSGPSFNALRYTIDPEDGSQCDLDQIGSRAVAWAIDLDASRDLDEYLEHSHTKEIDGAVEAAAYMDYTFGLQDD
ncbi:hypothetical protein [Curtobacterium flaccumfaciens]|uniref:hypothetical protein n=1 Tax=Curtobacterium flaccumfaciens TaxID=2035 RepID=UPI0038791DF7